MSSQPARFRNKNRVYHAWVEGQKASTERLTEAKSGALLQARLAQTYGVKTFQIVTRWIKKADDLALLQQRGVWEDYK